MHNTATAQASVTGDAFPCGVCGSLIWAGQIHTCAGTPLHLRSTNIPLMPSQPIPMYTLQCCPVCGGRGNVPAGFYGRMVSSTGTGPEPCQSCDGRGMLKVSIMGDVEKVG